MDFDDIVKIVDRVKGLEARLATVEAEREKYQGLADNRLNCMALYRNLIGKHEARIGVLADKLNLAEAERDAAQAGEARAVEVIQKLLKSAVPNRRDHPTMWDAWAFAERFLKEESRALDWLAQQRAEAAAESEDAKRNLWCEEKRVTVSHNAMTNKWTVITEEAAPWRRRYFDGKTRNEAIDKALRAGATGGKP